MNATTLQKATDAELRKCVNIVFLADEAQAEIDRRKAEAEANAGQLKAKGVVVKGLGKLTHDEALVIFKLLKPKASHLGITEEMVPAVYTSIRKALYEYLSACGTPTYGDKVTEYLTK